MKETYLIIDLGTGNSRVALTDTTGNILKIISFENIYHIDPAYDNARYFVPQEWMNKITAAIGELIYAYPDCRISAITATSAREGIVLIDKQGNSFIGLPNVDRRGEHYASTFSASEHDAIYRLSGRWSDTLFSALKLVGYKKVYPDTYENILSFTSLSEWIGYEFTHCIGMAPSHACETQLFDINANDWSSYLCHLHSIDPSILPEIKNSGTVLGNITPEFSQQLHLDYSVPFIITGADTQSAVRGINAHTGDVTIVSGTTSPIVSLVSNPLYDSQKRCWVNCGLNKDWLIETNAGTTGLNYQNYRNAFLPDLDYKTIELSLQKKKEFHCIASFGTKLFSQNRTLKNGGFHMNAPFGTVDRFDLAYALIADIACGISLHYDSLCDIIPHEKDYILGCGGGFQSHLLGQWIANLTNKNIILRGTYNQASIQGCVSICNNTLHNNTSYPKLFAEFYPKPDAHIHEYYTRWEAFRKMTNPL